MRLGPLSTFSSGLATAASGGIGRSARPSRPAAQPLELFGFEGSPQARLVRATLCELELPYLLRNAGAGSAAHEQLVARSGAAVTPWLHDPNTGTSATGAAAITAHLEQTYAA